MNSRASRVLVIVVGALLLLAVIAALVSSLRPVPQLEAGSPEAAVQSYVGAVLAGESADAHQHLDPDTGCAVEDLDRHGHQTRTTRVVLQDSTISEDGQEATVRVDLVHGSDAPIGGGEGRDAHSFRLRKAGSGWVITGDPWPMYGCAKAAQ